MRLSHVSLTARDADALSAFYKSALGFTERRSAKRLAGEAVSRGNGLPNCGIYSIWLQIPDAPAPFLEILQYDETVPRSRPRVNEPGFGHLAFDVENLKHTLDDLLRCGGSLQGQITNFGSNEQPLLIVYVRDPEGNILELAEPFRQF